MTETPVRDVRQMLAAMAPERRPGTFLFVPAGGRADLACEAVGTFAEAEGLSLILPEPVARAAGLDGPAMACLTLSVWSDLQGVGLTAAAAGALAAEGIAANVVAAYRHDHVFVPAAAAGRALAILEQLAARAAATAASTAAPAAGQHWSPADDAAHAAFVPDRGRALLALLAPAPGEAILDLGCGDGVLSAEIVAAGAQVAGLAADPSMAAAARARGIRVLEQDAHDPFGEDAFDAVFANAALHGMRDPPRVMANVFRALRPGGRLVAEQGGQGNLAAIATALDAARAAAGLPPVPPPWDFPSVARQRARLAAAGFAVEEIALVPRPTPLPAGIGGWLATFAGPWTDDLEDEAAAALRADAARRLAPWLHDPAAGWTADYVGLRFVARRPV